MRYLNKNDCKVKVNNDFFIRVDLMNYLYPNCKYLLSLREGETLVTLHLKYRGKWVYYNPIIS